MSLSPGVLWRWNGNNISQFTLASGTTGVVLSLSSSASISPVVNHLYFSGSGQSIYLINDLTSLPNRFIVYGRYWARNATTFGGVATFYSNPLHFVALEASTTVPRIRRVNSGSNEIKNSDGTPFNDTINGNDFCFMVESVQPTSNSDPYFFTSFDYIAQCSTSNKTFSTGWSGSWRQLSVAPNQLAIIFSSSAMSDFYLTNLVVFKHYMDL